MRSVRIVAEIEVRPFPGGGFSWYVYAPGVAADQSVGHTETAMEAVWVATGEIRRDGACGTVAILSADGESVAHAPLCAVPQYERLDWKPTLVSRVDLSPLAGVL